MSQIAQRGGRCPIPGNIPGQVGLGSEYPDPGEDVPAHCRGLDWMALKGPFQPNPFCDSMILCKYREKEKKGNYLLTLSGCAVVTHS